VQYFRGSVEVARDTFQLPQVRECVREPELVPDLAGDGDALRQHPPRLVQVVQPAVSAADPAELLGLVVAVAKIAPDSQAALEEQQSHLQLA